MVRYNLRYIQNLPPNPNSYQKVLQDITPLVSRWLLPQNQNMTAGVIYEIYHFFQITRYLIFRSSSQSYSSNSYQIHPQTLASSNCLEKPQHHLWEFPDRKICQVSTLRDLMAARTWQQRRFSSSSFPPFFFPCRAYFWIRGIPSTRIGVSSPCYRLKNRKKRTINFLKKILS